MSAGRMGYGWPLKPFRLQHPVRGNFGDPRTVSMGELGIDGAGTPGDFSFHNGLDIVANPGTPVFPVVSGIAHVPSGDEVTVRAGAQVFQYRHIAPAVRENQHVVADDTILGRVRYPAQHVHLTEIYRERVINPALHLRPYRDRTAPIVHALEFTDAAGHTLHDGVLTGPVSVSAWADDTPSIRAPGPWAGFPVAPAYVSWALFTTYGSKRLAHVVADFRHGEPPKQRFWTVYAAGTFQNFPVFDHHFYWRQPGRYLFRLTPRAIDTRRLANGIYTVLVVASDICGNRGTLTQRVLITNKLVAGRGDDRNLYRTHPTRT